MMLAGMNAAGRFTRRAIAATAAALPPDIPRVLGVTEQAERQMWQVNSGGH